MSGENLIERATRLELTDVEARESSVRGRFRAVLVDIDEAESELKMTFFLERPVSWKQISLKISEINDPDIVVTEDQPFDDSITVEAHDGAAPTVSHIFKDADVRAKTLDLFARFHEASFSRNKLVIARVPLEGAAATASTSGGFSARLNTQASHRLDRRSAPRVSTRLGGHRTLVEREREQVGRLSRHRWHDCVRPLGHARDPRRAF